MLCAISCCSQTVIIAEGALLPVQLNDVTGSHPTTLKRRDDQMTLTYVADGPADAVSASNVTGAMMAYTAECKNGPKCLHGCALLIKVVSFL